MLRWCIPLATAALLCGRLAALTPEEAAAYVRERPDLAAADVLALDAIERAVPVITGGTIVVAVTDTEAVAYAEPLEISVDGVLRYRIQVPQARARITRPPPALGSLLTAGCLGLAVGAGLTAILVAVLGG